MSHIVGIEAGVSPCKGQAACERGAKVGHDSRQQMDLRQEQALMALREAAQDWNDRWGNQARGGDIMNGV
jgi:hypothetical protein